MTEVNETNTPDDTTEEDPRAIIQEFLDRTAEVYNEYGLTGLDQVFYATQPETVRTGKGRDSTMHCIWVGKDGVSLSPVYGLMVVHSRKKPGKTPRLVELDDLAEERLAVAVTLVRAIERTFKQGELNRLRREAEEEV